jgi:hypothetical protein
LDLLLQQRFSIFFTIACAKTVAVVVLPSHFEATSLPFERPYFLMGLQFNFFGYSNAIFVTWWTKGFSNDHITTFGPRVTLTAFANASTPRFNPSRASISNFIFAILNLVLAFSSCLKDVFKHQNVLLIINL